MKLNSAIITGATSGIGASYASRLAKEGYDLMLTGRRKERLIRLKDKLERSYGVNVKIFIADLTDSKQLDHFILTIRQMKHVKMLINNAGYGCSDRFFDSMYTDQQKMLQLHIVATTKLIHEVAPIIVKNGGGSIINVSSLAAFLPSGQSYFYCSTKAFLVSFSECLHCDLIHSGVKVQALCPGYTETEFHKKTGKSKYVTWMQNRVFWNTPDEVVNYSMKGLSKQKVICIPGLMNRIIYVLTRITPKWIYYRFSTKKKQHSDVPILSSVA